MIFTRTGVIRTGYGNIPLTPLAGNCGGPNRALGQCSLICGSWPNSSFLLCLTIGLLLVDLLNESVSCNIRAALFMMNGLFLLTCICRIVILLIRMLPVEPRLMILTAPLILSWVRCPDIRGLLSIMLPSVLWLIEMRLDGTGNLCLDKVLVIMCSMFIIF